MADLQSNKITLTKIVNGQNGAPGTPGTPGDNGYNQATIYLYARADSAPSKPSNSLTYTFSTGNLNSIPTGWNTTIPTGDKPCWIMYATAISNTNTDTIASTDWKIQKLVENGVDGENGYNQATINLYQRASSIPSAPTGLTYTFSTGNINGTLGLWSRTVPTNNGQICYITSATIISREDTGSLSFVEPTILVENGKDGKDAGQYQIHTNYQRVLKYYEFNDVTSLYIDSPLTFMVYNLQAQEYENFSEAVIDVELGNYSLITYLKSEYKNLVLTSTNVDNKTKYSLNISKIYDDFSSSQEDFINNLNSTLSNIDKQAFISFLEILFNGTGGDIRISIIKNDEYSIEKFVELKNGLSEEMLNFTVNARNITAAVENTGLQFGVDGLTVTNGGFKIQKQLEGQNPETLLEYDKDKQVLNINGNGIFTGDIYANNGEFTGIIHATDGDFTGEIIANGGSIGGFTISEGKLTSTDNNHSIELKGTDGSIVANNIKLGIGAEIDNYLKLGNAFIYNPEHEDRNGSRLFISAGNSNNEQGYLKIYDTGNIDLGNIKLQGQDSIINLNSNDAKITAGNNVIITPDRSIFNNVDVTGTIHTSVFEVGKVQTAGGAMIFKEGAEVDTIVQNGNNYNFTTKTPINLVINSIVLFTNKEESQSSVYGQIIEVNDNVYTTSANIMGYTNVIQLADTKENLEAFDETTESFDNTPYNFRKSGGDISIGDKLTDEIVGGTVAWNQFIGGEFYANGCTASTSSGVTTITPTASNNRYTAYKSGTTTPKIPVIKDHVYLQTVIIKSDGTNPVGFQNYLYLPFANKTTSAEFVTLSAIGKATDTGDSAIQLWSQSGTAYQIKEGSFMLFDLTLMFGSTIADYIYSLGTAHTGDGVAYFKSLFPNDYYAYDSGTLMSVQTSEHKMVGKNLISVNSIVLGGDNPRYALLPIDTPIPQGIYTISCINNSNCNINIGFYDATSGGNSTGSVTFSQGQTERPVTLTGKTLRLYAYISQTNYDNGKVGDLSNIQMELGSATPYESYAVHSYPLDSSLILRGIPKLVDNKLLYDGDIYQSDGTVTRKYRYVDLGTLTWQYNSSYGVMYANPGSRYAIKDSGLCVCQNYIYMPNSDRGVTDKSIGLGTTGWFVNTIWVRDSAYTDATTFKSAMSGVHLVYELATPISETATPYTNPQIVAKGGTEEYIDARNVAIPVGHNTYYSYSMQNNLVIGINSGSHNEKMLYPQALTMREIIGFENNEPIYQDNPSLVLGNLDNIIPSNSNIKGFGLYGQNVYLTGSLVTEFTSGQNVSYAGVNTFNGVTANVFDNVTGVIQDNSKIVFWGGALPSEYGGDLDSAIKNAPFQVTENGSFYAGQGYFKGAIITDAEIRAASIYTADIYGIGTSEDEDALKIHDTTGGIGFYNGDTRLLDITNSGFSLGNETDKFININGNIVNFTGNTFTGEIFRGTFEGNLTTQRDNNNKYIGFNGPTVQGRQGTNDSYAILGYLTLDTKTILTNNNETIELNSGTINIDANITSMSKDVYFGGKMKYQQVSNGNNILGYDLFIS